MWNIGKLFRKGNRSGAAQGGAVNPAARAAPAQQSMVGAHRQGASQRSAQSVMDSVDAAIAMANAAVADSPVAESPAASPRAGQMQMNYSSVIQSLQAKQAQRSAASTAPQFKPSAPAPLPAPRFKEPEAPAAAPIPAPSAPAPLSAPQFKEPDAPAFSIPAPQFKEADAAPVPQAEAAQSVQAAIEVIEVTKTQPASAKVAGLICVQDLYAKGGLSGAEPLPAKAKAVMDALAAYHDFMDARTITVSEFRKKNEHLPEVQALDTVIRACNGMVEGVKGGKKSSAFMALLPGVSQLLIQAYQLMPMIASMDRILLPYVFATGSDQVSMAQLIESPQAKALMGAMSSISAQDGIPRDGGAEVMRQYGKSAKSRKNAKKKKRVGKTTGEDDIEKLGVASSGSVEAEARARLFPSLDSSSFIGDSARLLQMLDDLSTKTSEHALHTHREHLYVMRLLSRALASPMIQALCSDDPVASTMAEQDASAADQDLMDELRRAAGKTVGDLSKEFTDFLLSEGQITQVSEDAFKTGGELSDTYLDADNDGVFRTTKGDEDYTDEQNFEHQKKAFNGSYDEAMSKLDEALGLGVIAKAEVAAYKNKEGKAQIGSKMEFVDGRTMSSILKEVGMKNVGEETDIKTARMLDGYLRLAVVDYIAMHADRNPGNYIYNPDAEPGESVIKGIDNDMVFNMNPDQELGQGTKRWANPYDMIRERNGGQAEKRLVSKNGLDRTIQARSRAHALSLSAFEVVTPEIKELVMGIDEAKVSAALRPYVNVTARLAALERIKELQTYVSGAKVVSMQGADGNTSEENMQEYYNTLDRNAIMAMLTTSGVEYMNGKLTIRIYGSHSINLGGSAAGFVWAGEQRARMKEFLAQGTLNEQLPKYFAQHGFGLGDIFDVLVGHFRDTMRDKLLEQLGATEDDRDTQDGKLKAFFLAQPPEQTTWTYYAG